MVLHHGLPIWVSAVSDPDGIGTDSHYFVGTQNCFISAAFIGLAASLAFLPMVKWGKKFRERQRMQYWNLVRKNIQLGAVH